MAFTVPNLADAGFTSQAELDSRDLGAILALGFQRYGVLTGCAVTAQGSPNMTVAVASGNVLVAGKVVSVASQNATITTADATNPRVDLITVSGSQAVGTVTVVAGTPAADPAFPDPAGNTVLAAVYVPANDTAVNTNQITDKRVILVNSNQGFIDVSDYGAVPDDFYTDGVSCTGTNTTLSAAITTVGQSSITVSSASGFPASGNYYIVIDSEVLQVTAGQGTTTWTVSRGQLGSTAATHSNAAAVKPAFTSATAGFTSADVGVTIVALRAGASSLQDHHTTIATFVTSQAVVLTNNANRVQSSVRFYLSRAGDQTTAIQAAITAAVNRGGGTVFFPGVGYLTSGITNGNRVTLCGAGKAATMIHLAASSNCPVIVNDCTANNSAMFTAIRDMRVDGNRARQSNVTTTINASASYTAGGGQTTIETAVGGGANLLPGGGMITIGTNKLQYGYITFADGAHGGDTLHSVTGGYEGTTDANAVGGATITQIKAIGICFGLNPDTQVPTTGEEFDPHQEVSNVWIKNTKGDGITANGQSENRWHNVTVEYSDEISFRPSFDSWLSNCTSDKSGRHGFFFRSSEIKATNCKAFYAGNVNSAEGHGFFLEGFTTAEEGTKVLSSCGTQDCQGAGFYFRNAQRVVLQGSASSNSRAGAGTWAGVHMTSTTSPGTSHCIIDVVCTERNANGNNQTSALFIDSICNSNDITLTHGASSGATVGAAIMSSSVVDRSNTIRISGTPSYAAGSWVTISKSADTARTTNAVLTADPDLQFAMVSGTKYRVRGTIFFDTAATPDFQYSFSGPTGTIRFNRSDQPSGAGTVLAERAPDVAMPGATSIVGTGTTGGCVKFDAIIEATSSTTFSFNWAQNTSNGSATTVLAGSYIEWMIG